MKVGVVSDIHGNLTALQTVLDDMPAVDQLVCLGDVVGYGPHPRECVKLIQEHATVSLYGNHESYLETPSACSGNNDAYQGIQHARRELTDEQRNWCFERPYTDMIDGSFKLAHGHPDPETPFAYVLPKNVTELVPYFREHEWGMLAVGHSHIQFKQDLQQFHDDAGLVFNPGSVGQPRDKNPDAAYAVADTDTNTVQFHRVSYDVDSVVNAIDAVGLPSPSGERLKNGTYPSRTRRRL